MRTNAIASAMRVFGRRPWIAHVHGWLGQTHHGRWRLYEAVDRQLVRTADRVLVGSRAAQDEVRRFGAKHVHVVSNAVTLPKDDPQGDQHAAAIRAEIGAADGALILGVVGRLHPGKGHEFFLRALAALIEERLNVHGLIIGEGPDGDRLRELAKTLGIADKVTFTGFVDDSSRYLFAIDIVAVPSLKDSLPLTALEAMSFGRPVVASCAGDLPLLIDDGDNGFVIPIGHHKALADKLRVLVGDEPLRRRMGAAGRQRIIDGFSAETMARGLEAQYASVISAANGHGARA
jgi:glycosyltransferase involved in cell wall biosynthesis